MATTFGTRPEDTVADSRGNVLSGVVLKLYPTEADATAQTSLVASVSTDSRGLFRYSDDQDRDVLYVRDPSGSVWCIEAQGRLADKVPKAGKQQAELVANYAYKFSPATTGFADFQIVSNSFANNGAGAGTYNHGTWFGWNASRHADSAGSGTTTGRPAVYMGFEDNYYDPDGDHAYGVEWYTGYVSPDGTTVPIADLRPIYWRLTDSTTNTTSKNVILQFDIGSGASGQFGIWGSVKTGKQLFTVTPTQVLSGLPLNVLGGGQYSPTTGPVNLMLKSATNTNAADTASLSFQLGATPKFQLTADKFNEIYLFDNVANRIHTNWVTGATSDAAYVEFNATLKLNNSTSTSATAGAATALPATPAGYFQIKDSAGTVRKVPYYA